MNMRQALAKFRKAGFSTTRQDGTWYLSKPYHTADRLAKIEDVLYVVLVYGAKFEYQTVEEFEENGGFTA